MIQSVSDMKDSNIHAKVSVENRSSANDSSLINGFQSNPKSDSEKAINESTVEQQKKQNMRQLLRLLREDESNDSGPLLATSLDQADMTDDEGFTPAHHKNRRPKLCLKKSNEEIISNDMKLTPIEYPESEPKNVSEQKDKESNYEIASESEKLKERTTIQTSKNKERKEVWSCSSQTRSIRAIDLGECTICYKSWLEDKVILEDKVTLECGHLFHSECIRLWMKQKNTCPFCARFSLLPDEFPRLT